ncbi:hypothetical protein J2Z65_002859 [Paenibacillus aceris]|uniref:Uncharacterized protein n=1 Tax=Paenibacillus aceris TaxID=869555 RepID=A0ABS4HYC1_9BACL|nr:hypothetical protein [Paenibacillus aceris]
MRIIQSSAACRDMPHRTLITRLEFYFREIYCTIDSKYVENGWWFLGVDT